MNAMNEDDIKLFPHNEKAFKLLDASLIDEKFAFIEHATGTGKTVIILKYLYARMREMRIFFVTLHDEMFDQLFGKQMKLLGMTRDDFRQFDTLIYHNLIKINPKKLLDDYDCIVFDEAHHCGAPKWKKIVLGIKEEVKRRENKKMIGLTATGIRYLDNYQDVAETYFEGNVVSRLNVVEAMLRALLPAPIYVNSIVACREKYERVLYKLRKLPRTKEILDIIDRMEEIGKRIDDNSSVGDLLKKYNVKPGEKYIVFCKDINDLKRKKEEAKEWFKDIGEINIFEAHSAQKKEKNREQISEFEKKSDKISLMFAVDIFNEGFHIDDLDGILMFRKTSSPIVYLQQIGRALSFSARKKQIKIFDFVDNISNNDVIRELYKELVSEAKRLVEEEPENKKLFEDIIKRFEIVDYTSSTMETLDEINAYLDENFTFRNSIVRAISKLQEYRDKYPNNDIHNDILYGRLESDYLRAYNHIIAMDKYLTLSNIEALNSININFNGEILMDIDRRRELLNGHSSYNEYETYMFNNFRLMYIEFTNEHGRRPMLGNSLEEDKLYNDYREYLGKLSKKEIINLVSKFNFRLSVEETVLIGNYPNKDDLYDYFSLMAEFVVNGIGFDRIQLKVLKKLKDIIPAEFYQLKDYLEHSRDINTLMDEAISVLKKHELSKVVAKEKGYVTLINSKEVLRARRFLSRYANHVNNEQFKELLELKISLPKEIDMTWDERLKRLGEYNSFYEKEVGEETSVVNKYFDYIAKNGKRPDDGDTITLAYEEFLLNTSISKVKVMCASLDHYKISHSLLEKVLLGEKATDEELNEYADILEAKKKEHEILGRKDLKILRYISQNQSGNRALEMSDLLKIQTTYRRLDALISNYEITRDTKSYNDLTSFLKVNNDYVTASMIDRLRNLDITFSLEFENMVNNLGEFKCLKEKKLTERRKLQSSIEKYVNETKKRPARGSDLDKEYRAKIAKMLKSEIVEYLRIFKNNGLRYTVEELIILERATRAEILSYVYSLNLKVEAGKTLDELEKRIINKLNSKGYLNDYPKLKSLLPGYRRQLTVEDKLVNQIEEQIVANPSKPIDFDVYTLNVSMRRLGKLEAKRMNILISRFLREVLLEMREKKCSIKRSLSDDDYELYQAYLYYSSLNEENMGLIEEIKEVDRGFKAIENKIDKEIFIEDYLEFIRKHNGERPNYASEDEYEESLATMYENMREYLSRNEILLIERAIKDSQTKVGEDFYQEYVDFVLAKKRMPCGNSDDPYEVKLNNLYLNYNRDFSKEQSLNVQKLRKTYSKETMKATIEFNKIKD